MHYWYACYQPSDGVAAPVQAEVPLYEVPWRDAHGEHIVDFVDGQDIMVWVTQGPIADRTQEILGSSDRGIALYRQLLFDQIKAVRAGDDPLGVIRDPERNAIIELPQEREKFGQGAAFLAESMAMGHARYSPIKDEVLALLARE
jgi:5,5'-dehydrodivanillate O-demethylase